MYRRRRRSGGLIARLLVDAGLRVVLLEAGPWYQDPRRDFAEDELTMRKTQWPESQYTITGTAAGPAPVGVSASVAGHSCGLAPPFGCSTMTSRS